MSQKSSIRYFDFTQAIARLCDDITHRLEPFHHICMDNVAVTFAQTRLNVSHGLQAKLTPMRFEDGNLESHIQGERWTVKRLFRENHEIYYILTFYLPRFFDQSFHEKLVTVIHELYHISPFFNGDIRRLEGRYHVHSHSQKEYDMLMEVFVDDYLSRKPPTELFQFLENDFINLKKKYGNIVGLKLPNPKLIRIDDRKSA